MKKFLLFLFLILLAIKVNSQHILSNNLVPNPGFEEYTNCPYDVAQIYYAPPWLNCCSGTIDYYNACSSFIGIQNIINSNPILSGNAYAGIYLLLTLSENWREYLQVKLIKKMQLNKKYCINYNFKLDTESNFAIESIDMFISKEQIPITSINNPLWKCDSIPQIKNKKGIINNYNWAKMSSIFQASGGEEFIVIGNFNNDNQTNRIQLANTNIYEISYYLFDDVSVCECSFDINLGQDTSLCEGESLILIPNLPNATYTWQDSSHAATYEVKQPGTYWVRAYVAEYDVYSSDTIVITKGDESYCNPPLTIPNVITPNGDSYNDNFVIQNAESYTLSLQIYNRWGRLIYENTNYQNNFSCKDCANGVYFYVLKAKSKRNGREKEYKGSLTIING